VTYGRIPIASAWGAANQISLSVSQKGGKPISIAEDMSIAFVSFSFIAGLSWFFSYRPRLFIRVFVPRDELRGAIRGILKDPNFGNGIRVMALLQSIVAAVFGLIAFWLWLG
jgi:hypothetical protein